METFLDRWYPFQSEKVYQCTELPNMNNRKYSLKSTSPLHSTKIPLQSTLFYDGVFWLFLPILSLVSCISVFTATTSFQLFNSMDAWMGSLLSKLTLLHTLQIWWSSCWSFNLEILGLSDVIPLQPGHPDHLIFIRVSSGYAAIWKMGSGVHFQTYLNWGHTLYNNQSWNMPFPDFNLLLKTVDSILIIFSLKKFKKRFDGCFFCGFFYYFYLNEDSKNPILLMFLYD